MRDNLWVELPFLTGTGANRGSAFHSGVAEVAPSSTGPQVAAAEQH